VCRVDFVRVLVEQFRGPLSFRQAFCFCLSIVLVVFCFTTTTTTVVGVVVPVVVSIIMLLLMAVHTGPIRQGTNELLGSFTTIVVGKLALKYSPPKICTVK